MIGWLLDTNVISELTKRNCDRNVATWARAQPEDRMFISILSLGEYDKGISNLSPESPARARLEAAVAAIEVRFSGRIASLDDTVVRRWGRISGMVRKTDGQWPPVIDTMLAEPPSSTTFASSRAMSEMSAAPEH